MVTLCDAVKNFLYGEIVPGASPKGEGKSNGEVERAVQSVHGLARTLKVFLEQKSGIALESEDCCWPGWSSIVPIFSYPSTMGSRTTVTQPT